MLKTLERDRLQFSRDVRAAAGSQFALASLEARRGRLWGATVVKAEEELRSAGRTLQDLIGGAGKLSLLDRLLKRCKAAGSRVLLFSQYTLTLDVLEEYALLRFGPKGAAYLRLDGATNRVAREMDVRCFNATPSIFLYLISTTAGGMGINLATADTVVLYDTSWNPQVRNRW